MPRRVVLIENTSLWWREVNIPGPFRILEVENTSLGDLTIAGLPTVTPTFSRDANGKFVKLFDTEEAPGDLSSVDILHRVQLDSRHPLYKFLINLQDDIYLQRASYPCPPVNDRVRYLRLEHYLISATGGTKAATRDLNGSGGSQNNTITVAVKEDIEVYKGTLSRITITEAESILCIAGLNIESDCLLGYPGPDRILVIGAVANAAPANAQYSVTGGGSFAAFTTDSTPFTVSSSLTAAAIFPVSETHYRVVWLRAGDAGTKAQISWDDFRFSAQTLTATWNLVTIAASTNADDGEAILPALDQGRIYLAVEGDIYVSEDFCGTDPGAAILTTANAIAGFTRHNDDIWSFAATNDIRVELATNRDTFAARVGPTGGGAFTALSFADDGTMFAGNGTSIYRSMDEAASVEAWTSLKDFGASRVVKSILCKDGSSELLRVTVDNTTPGVSEIWNSDDGGATWQQVTASANDGYNAVYYPRDIDQQITVGDDVGSLGYVEQLA